MLASVESKLHVRIEAAEALVEQRCNDLRAVLCGECDWWRRRSECLEASLTSCQQRLESVESVWEKRVSDLTGALWSESESWRQRTEKLEEDIAIGTRRLEGVEVNVWNLHNVNR